MAPLLLLAAACYEGPAEFEISDVPRHVEVASADSWSVDAFYPTDLVNTGDGALLVLDSYRGRVVRVSTSGKQLAVLADADTYGRPTRLSLAGDGGVWLVEPHGQLLRIDDAGLVLQRVTMPAPDGDAPPWAPIDVLDTPTALVVADREGRLAWLDRASGEVTRVVAANAEGNRFGVLTDLIAGPEDGVRAVDATGATIRSFTRDGAPLPDIGTRGAWVGSLSHPKSATDGPSGTLLVADSEQGVIELFEASTGQGIGVLTQGGAPLDLGHPVAIRASGADAWVLDGAGSKVWHLTLDPVQLDAAVARAGVRTLREPLGTPASAGDPATCVQCHDGLVEDGREVWDPAMKHHPVDIVPEKAIPAFFPLEDGKLTCATCHSPHGATELADALGVDGDAGRDEARRAPAAEGEAFTRMSRGDDALCVACHGETAHDDAAAILPTAGSAHPSGAALRAAMARTGMNPTAASQSACLDCHATHGATGDHLLRGTTDGRVCAACHTAQAATKSNHPTGHDVRGHGAAAMRFGLDGEGGLTCLSCHELVGGSGRALLADPVGHGLLCGACHDQRDELAGGAHRGVRGQAGTPCLGCHDLHGGDDTGHLLRTLARATSGDPLGCATCHGDEASGRRGHPVDGRTIATGPSAGEPLVCETCHSAHDPTPPGVDACLACHADQADAAKRGGHGDADCLDCHPAHDATPMAVGVAEHRTVNPSSGACLGCHGRGETAGAPWIDEWEHPTPVFTPDGKRWQPLAGLPLYGPDGRPVAAGQSGELTCASCHETHGPDAEKAGDKLRRPGWKEVCSSCHGADALVYYRYFHRPDRRKATTAAPGGTP